MESIKRLTDDQLDYIHGLEVFAAFLRGHPNVPRPASVFFNSFVQTKEDFLQAVEGIGYSEKRNNGTYFSFMKKFGKFIIFEINVPTGQTCKKIVKGVERVEGYVQPAYDREVIEWECEDSVLATAVEDVS